MPLEGGDRFDAVAGFGDHVQVRLVADDVGDAGAHQRVIVDDEHGRLGGGEAAGSQALYRCAASAPGDEVGNGERGRLPRQHDLGAGARRGHDRERGADAIGALLHAGHAEADAAPLLRDAAAVVGDRQPEADRADAFGDGRGCGGRGVADGVGQRFLRDAEDLAVGAARERRQLA